MKKRLNNYIHLNKLEIIVLCILATFTMGVIMPFTRKMVVSIGEFILQRDLDNDWWITNIKFLFAAPLLLLTVYYIDYLFIKEGKRLREVFAVNMIAFWMISNHYIRLARNYIGYNIAWDNSDFIRPVQSGYGSGSLYGTNYPPLAVLLFRWLHQYVIDKDGNVNEIAVMYVTNILIVLVTLILAFAFGMWIKEISYSYMYILTAFLSSSMMFCFCRLNIMFIALIFTMFFLLGYKNENKYIRYLSLTSLAIAANIKYFPAIFGLLLIKERRWKEGFVCAFLGILLFLSPILIPKNNILVSNSYNQISEDKNIEEIENEENEIQLVIKSTDEFGNSARTLGRTLSTKSIVFNILKPLGIEKENSLVVGNIILIVNSVFLLFGFFIVTRRDYELLILSVFAILLVPTSNWYFTIFLLIPFLEFLKLKEYSRLDALNMLIWIDIFTYRWGFCNKFYLQDWRELLVLWIFLIFVIFKETKNKLREKKSEGCNFSWW